MIIVYALVPFALLMGLGFLWIFVWNARSGQYEDLITPAIRILIEEKKEMKKEKNNE